jgi:hypothetical protein
MSVTPIEPRERRTYPSVLDVLALPWNSNAEAAILGGVILRNETLDLVEDLAVDDFFDLKHRIVWAAIRNLRATDRSIDVVTLEVEIEKQEKLDAIGGIAFLGELVLICPLPDNMPMYRDIVLNDARNRRLQIDLASALERAKNWPHDPRELFSEIVGQLTRIEADTRIGESVQRAGIYGSPFKGWLGDTEPGDNPQDIFDAHGLIVRAEPSLFLGDPKVGKTLIITDLALHLAAGRREWCGVPLYRRCKVLALLREDSERTTRRRIFQMARGAGIERSELDGWLEIDGVTPLYFDNPKHVAQLSRQLKQYDVVLIDSLSTIHNGDENSVESMAPVMNLWRDMSLTTKTSRPIIHHFRKSPNERGVQREKSVGDILQSGRGSSIIAATTRHGVGISRGPEKHQVVIGVQSNHDVDVEPFVIARLNGTTDSGERFLRHVRIGDLRDARAEATSARVDPVVLEVLRGAGTEGLGGRALRDAVSERMTTLHDRGVKSSFVDQSVRRLVNSGHVEHLRLARKWRVL